MKFTIITITRFRPSELPIFPDWYSFGTATEDGRRTWLSMTTNTQGVDPEDLQIGDTVDLPVVQLDPTFYRAIDPDNEPEDLAPRQIIQPAPKRPQISELLQAAGISRRQEAHINPADGSLTIVGATARSIGMSDQQIEDMGPDGNLTRSNDAVLAMHALLLSIQIPEHVHRNESWQQYLSYRPLYEIGDTAHANALAELLTDREVLEWARRADDLLETAARTVRLHGPEHVSSPQQALLHAAAQQTRKHHQLYGHATDESITEIVRLALSTMAPHAPPPFPPGANNVNPPSPLDVDESSEDSGEDSGEDEPPG